ncbi:MAG: hypothetical protein M3Y77_04200 [Actinomycetota bacterium]|nr:hypothetical protein [Actinomycetota bacterium]
MGENLRSEQAVVMTAEALRRGMTKYGLDQQGRRRLTRGIYASGKEPIGLSTRARAVQVASGETAILSHFTAARLLGGAVPHRSEIHVTVPGTKRVRRPGVVTHRTRRRIRTSVVRNLKVTDAVQTFLDLACQLDLVDLVILGDSLVAKKLSSPTELIEAARTWRGVGVALAREAAVLVRQRVGSPRETRLRLLLVLAGLPEPTIDFRIYAAAGRVLFHLDLAYEEYKLGIEYDGRQHAESDSQWLHDVNRREYFDGHGWRLVIVIGQHFYPDPGGILDRVVKAARAQGMRIPDPDPQWRQYFRSGITI